MSILWSSFALSSNTHTCLLYMSCTCILMSTEYSLTDRGLVFISVPVYGKDAINHFPATTSDISYLHCISVFLPPCINHPAWTLPVSPQSLSGENHFGLKSNLIPNVLANVFHLVSVLLVNICGWSHKALEVRLRWVWLKNSCILLKIESARKMEKAKSFLAGIHYPVVCLITNPVCTATLLLENLHAERSIAKLLLFPCCWK